ncbi:MAG: ABC transporter ATP-binding protein [Candidatus Rokubacteria bacterium]|nr:ABC transporter ATP-binding protein [Candidatus Rokubacteria bacterium]
MDFAPAGRAPLRALERISLDVHPGEFVAIVGPSGCGKSTLLNLVAGLARPTAGSIEVDGRPVTGPRKIGYMFQGETLLPWRTVFDNVALGPELTGVPLARRRSLVLDLLAQVGLADFGDALPHELSGGMRKRAQLAAVLANEPGVVLMDEPFGALDAQTRAVLEDDLVRLWRGSRKSIVFVTHDLAEAILLSTRVIIFTARPGRIKAEYPITLPAGDSTLEQRTTAEFHQYYAKIWADLRDEVGHRLG